MFEPRRDNRPPIISLTTDFGEKDGYVGTMRGVILSICPSAILTDLSHDVPPQESQIILKNTIIKVHELTTEYNLITVLTNLDSKLYSNRIRNTIQSYVHETVRMKYIEPCTYVDLTRRQESTTILHMAEGQLRLEHFGMVT